MTTTEPKSPYGRGFIAAATILTTILACGAVLLLKAPPHPPQPPPPSPPPATPVRHRAGRRALPPPHPGRTAHPPPPPDLAPKPKVRVQRRARSDLRPHGRPRSSGATSASGDGRLRSPPPARRATPYSSGSASDLGAATGSGDTSGKGVVVAGGGSSVPVGGAWGGWVGSESAGGGAALLGVRAGSGDRDGFRRCFAHSPTGAVFAAYNVIAAMADQHQALATVGKLMVPGRDTEELLKQLRKRPDDQDEADPDRRLSEYSTRAAIAPPSCSPSRSDRLRQRHLHADLARRRLATGRATARPTRRRAVLATARPHRLRPLERCLMCRSVDLGCHIKEGFQQAARTASPTRPACSARLPKRRPALPRHLLDQGRLTHARHR